MNYLDTNVAILPEMQLKYLHDYVSNSSERTEQNFVAETNFLTDLSTTFCISIVLRFLKPFHAGFSIEESPILRARQW